MRAIEVASIIEAWAPVKIQEAWDNSGFCVGSPQTELCGILLCLDVTQEVLEEALALGANMVISHHPIIFKGLKQLCEQTEVERMVAFALRHHLVVYAMHTNADKVANGVSGALAAQIGLVNQRILSADTLNSGEVVYGLGIIGELPEAVPAGLFIERIKKVLQLSVVRASALCKQQIKTVALCGGSGSSLIPQALSGGADMYLSGDLGYHDFFAGEGQMMVADIGHYESEIGIISLIRRALLEKNLTFAVYLTTRNTNPIHYL